MTITKHCLQCGETLPDQTPSDKPFCSTACQQTLYPLLEEESNETDQETVSQNTKGLRTLKVLGLFGLALLTLIPPPKPKRDTGLSLLDKYPL